MRKQVDGYKADFYVDQNVLAADRDGNRFVFLVKAAGRSLSPNELSCHSRLVENGETLHVLSAKVMSHYESRGVRYTRLGYVKLENKWAVNAAHICFILQEVFLSNSHLDRL